MKRIRVKEEACVNCRLCEFYCAAEHHPSKSLRKAFGPGRERPAGRVRVAENGPLSFALVCRHCDEPLCVFACVSGAMRKDPESGRVIHDPGSCVGCLSCLLACPVGAIIWDEKKEVVGKCDFCPGREIPACVENCPNEALVLEEQL